MARAASQASLESRPCWTPLYRVQGGKGAGGKVGVRSGGDGGEDGENGPVVHKRSRMSRWRGDGVLICTN